MFKAYLEMCYCAEDGGNQYALVILGAVEKNKDKEMRKAEAIKVALAKAKQLAARAFKEDIIDQLSTAVEEQPLFHAGTMLDASARVYSFRVDVTHSEACDVRMKLGDPKTLEKAETREKQTREQHDDDMNASPGSSDSEKEDDGPTDGTRKAQNDFNDEVGRKKQIQKERTEREGSDIGEEADDKIAPRLDESCDVEDLSLSVVEFDSDNEEGVVDTEQLIKKLKKKVDSAHAKCLQRRSKVAMVATDTADLDDLEEASQFCSHLYSKATHNFDEGSTSGLLMQNAATGKHGRRLMLHNDVKCPPDPPREKIDADDLLPFYGLIDDIEKAEPPGSATVFGDCDPSTSLLADLTAQVVISNLTAGDETQSFPGPDGNATFAVDAYLTTPERCALLSNLKEFLKRNPPCSLKDALFVSRTRLQKELRISSRKFAKVLVEPALCLSLAHAILTPPGNLSSAMRSAESESCIASAVVADELELFEESFDWVVNRMRWDKMKDARRAAALKTLPGEDPEYNYFFARSSDSRFSLEECVDAEEDACFWRSEVVIRDKESRVTEQDYKMLAQVLADFKVVKVGSLFTRKGDAFNRTLAAVPIITPARKRVRPATGMNVELEATATSYGRLNADGMTDTEAILGMDVHEEFSGDLGNAWDDDAFAAEDSALPADQSAIGGDIQVGGLHGFHATNKHPNSTPVQCHMFLEYCEVKRALDTGESCMRLYDA
ncbi:unnamed protein product [Toxocara canis]|uniref:Condensin complex subunit 2 n=1 Tax=Toxocara canis TaxID=6265 RepID=A0A183V1Z1_TOXCA|nr:unnamed protein product [Toxocara canis]